NNAQFMLTGAPGTTYRVTGAGAFNNGTGATIDVPDGATLRLGSAGGISGSSANRGRFNLVAAGSTLTFDGSHGHFAVNALSGLGTVNFVGGTQTFLSDPASN